MRGQQTRFEECAGFPCQTSCTFGAPPSMKIAPFHPWERQFPDWRLLSNHHNSILPRMTSTQRHLSSLTVAPQRIQKTRAHFRSSLLSFLKRNPL